MKNFFNRLKNEKDLRFDLFIGIWSAIIILAIVAVIGVCIYFFVIKGESIPKADNVKSTEAPTEQPQASFSPAPTVEPTERPPYENIDDTEDEEGAEDEDNEDSDSDASAVTVYAVTTVNVRSKPNTSAASYGKLSAGDSVKRIEKMSNGWSEVTYNNKTAYVKSDYLSITKPDTAAKSPTKAPSATSSAKATKKPASKKPASKKPTATPKKSNKEPSEDNEAPVVITATPEPEKTAAPHITSVPEKTEVPHTDTEPPKTNTAAEHTATP